MPIVALEKYTRNISAGMLRRAAYDAETHHNMSN